MPITDYVILWEYDKPVDHSVFRNLTSGLWNWYLTPGSITVTDDRGVIGFYRYTNSIIYDIQSLVVDAVQYSRVYSFSDLYNTNQSFYYDRTTTQLMVHFTDYEPPFTFGSIVLGAVVGFSKGIIGDNKPYFNNIYYEPRIKKVFNINKKKDPLFYGILNYTTGSVSCINNDGYFDDWRSRNLFAQKSRILIGQKDYTYSQYEIIFQGLIENDSTSWTDFTVKLQDPRKGLTQPIATNLLTTTDWPTLPDDNVDKPKPIKYGLQRNSPCMCLNETAVSGLHTFLLCDSEYNAPSSCTAVYLDGVAISGASFDYTSGTFTLSASASVAKDGNTLTVADNLDLITADFTASSIQNGVSIIKDLIWRYDNKIYSTAFWDKTETAIAIANSRKTSVSIEDDTKLSEVIQQICVDIGGVFFSKNSGVYTVRLYDADRTVIRTIQQDEWLDEPEIDNNGNEFLSSVIIKYDKNIDDGTYKQYENINYKDEVFATYKSYKSTTIETNLTTLTDAQSKSEEIMSISKLVGNIVTRSIPYGEDLEIMDFVRCAPISRLKTIKGIDIDPDYAIYEVTGISYDFEKFKRKLTLRYIKEG